MIALHSPFLALHGSFPALHGSFPALHGPFLALHGPFPALLHIPVMELTLVMLVHCVAMIIIVFHLWSFTNLCLCLIPEEVQSTHRYHPLFSEISCAFVTFS